MGMWSAPSANFSRAFSLLVVEFASEKRKSLFFRLRRQKKTPAEESLNTLGHAVTCLRAIVQTFGAFYWRRRNRRCPLITLSTVKTS